MRNKISDASKWPKLFPALTPEQVIISNDFVQHWHDVLPSRYGIVDRFNHNYVVKMAPKEFHRTLEIGAGNGEHLNYEQLTPEQRKNYVAVDIRENMVAEFRKKFPDVRCEVADCEKTMDFETGYFDRILAIHILEHLTNLPAAVKELYRLCNKTRGTLSIVIPCEGSLLYSLSRKISAQRIFEKRYGQSYDWFISREHVNRPHEIFEELAPYFSLVTSHYWPIPAKINFFNLCIGATFEPKNQPSL